MCERVGEDSPEAKERESVIQREQGGGGCRSCVGARGRCTISAAARVMLHSNPRIKTSADSLKQITAIFPLSFSAPLLHDDRLFPPTLSCARKTSYGYFCFYQYLNCEGKKRRWEEEY